MVLGSRAAMGYVLGRGAGAAAAQWWLSGGVSAANVIAVYQPIGAASLAASYTNLANPGTYDATAPGVAPNWTAADGWIFTGTQHVRQPITFQQGYTFLIRFSNWTAQPILNARDTVAAQFLYLLPSLGAPSNHYFQLGAAGRQFFTTPGITSGVLGIAGNTAKCYRDGSYEGVVSSPQWQQYPAYFAAQNFNGTAVGTFASTYIQAWAIYDTELWAAQISAVSAAMAAL